MAKNTALVYFRTPQDKKRPNPVLNPNLLWEQCPYDTGNNAPMVLGTNVPMILGTNGPMILGTIHRDLLG